MGIGTFFNKTLYKCLIRYLIEIFNVFFNYIFTIFATFVVFVLLQKNWCIDTWLNAETTLYITCCLCFLQYRLVVKKTNSHSNTVKRS